MKGCCRMKFLTFSICLVLILSSESQSDFLRVPMDYGTIQAAVDQAQNYDILLILPGTYSESVLIANKNFLIIQPIGTGTVTMINPSGSTSITIENCSNITIRGINFNVRADNKHGIYIMGSTDVDYRSVNTKILNCSFNYQSGYSGNNSKAISNYGENTVIDSIYINGCHFGIKSGNSTDGGNGLVITRANIVNCISYAIYTSGCSGEIIQRSNFNNNGTAVYTSGNHLFLVGNSFTRGSGTYTIRSAKQVYTQDCSFNGRNDYVSIPIIDLP